MVEGVEEESLSWESDVEASGWTWLRCVELVVGMMRRRRRKMVEDETI